MRTSKTYSDQKARKNPTIWLKSLVVVASFLLAGTVHSQNWSQLGADLTGLEIANHYGSVVAMSNDGNTIAIGAPGLNVNSPQEFLADAGFVRVYTYNGKSWILKGNPINGEQSGDGFGSTLQISGDGNYIIVGAPFYDFAASEDIGMARVYHYANGKWTPASPYFIGQVPQQHYGFSVSISDDGDVVAIGAPAGNFCCEAIGHVQVFKRETNVIKEVVHVEGAYKSPGAYLQQEEWKQLGYVLWGDGQIDQFGTRVDLNANGKVLAVGAPGKAYNGHNSGAVNVYVLRNNNWVNMGMPIYGEFEGDAVGQSFDLSDDGSTIAIGVPTYSGMYYHGGKVDVYRFDSQNWMQKGVSFMGKTEYDYVGHDVALSRNGDFILFSSPVMDPSFIYGSETMKAMPDAGIDGEAYAYAQAYQWNYPGDMWGSYPAPEYHFVYYGWWTPAGPEILANTPDDFFGSSIAVAANTQQVVIGTCRASNSIEPCEGYVKMYKRQAPNTFTGQVGITANDANNSTNIVTTLPTPIMKQVYPNPTRGTVTVDMNSFEGNAMVSVYHVSGNLVMQQVVTPSNRFNLEITGKPGIYYVELVTEAGNRELVRVVKR